MPITIKGIRITSMTVTRTDEGNDKISCNYELISSEDKILAKQSMTTHSAYNETVFVPPSDVVRQITDAAMAYRKAIEVSLGIS